MGGACIVDEAGGDSLWTRSRRGTKRNEGDCCEMWWLVDELEKERRGQIVAGSREHGLIAKAS
jgi:hypothetical protein